MINVTSTKLSTNTSPSTSNITHVTANIILDDTYDTILFDTVLNTFFQCQLPDATLIEGKSYFIKNNGSGFVSINSNFAQTIDTNYSTKVLMVRNEAIKIQSDGTNWFLIG